MANRYSPSPSKLLKLVSPLVIPVVFATILCTISFLVDWFFFTR